MASTPLPNVAYFCMEYGLSDQLKTYSGGLGILAGDHLKGAKDSNLPIVGIGIKWKHGYGRQVLQDDNSQEYVFPDYDYSFLKDTGVEVTVPVAGTDIRAKVWLCDTFGTVPLYLLDTDVEGNPEPLLTGVLYGGSPDARVAQEMILGIGGVRAIRALGLDIDLYHFNEGHALLAAFELIREKMDQGASYAEAVAETKAEVVFTTHTPVLAGNEVHPIDRLVRLGADLGLGADKLEALGGNPFGMTVGGLKLASKANGVAQLHGVTANQMWSHVEGRPHIHAITNGIHRPTWVDDRMLDAAAADDLDGLWASHQDNKRALINLIESRVGVTLDANKLLIGFARRAVTYKRANLIFSDLERIGPALESGQIQLVFSGKAHPQDKGGQALVSELIAMTKKYPNSVVYLPNYDMEIGAALTRGVDVWLNNPRRPKEASGTSGMKAAMNGVLNCSILDGWWPEACDHGVNGWQIGDGFESPEPAIQDAHDVESLYKVVLGEVVPTYYDDRPQWQQMMHNSIQSTREEFSIKRMLEHYVEQLYLPAVAETA
ncbi:MAG: alpha-glucan family phosphorylase [Bacteroidota bacterium]